MWERLSLGHLQCCKRRDGSVLIASRTFTLDDQALFARISGDRNPIHVDPEGARRTQAGATVVHGVHAVLWAIEELIKAGILAAGLGALDVRFAKFIFVDSPVELKIVHRDAMSIRAELCCGTLTTTTLALKSDAFKTSGEVAAGSVAPLVTESEKPARFTQIEELAGLSGRFRSADAARKIEQSFPHATSLLGLGRVISIAQLSTLVGMVCPGLYSLFASFKIDLIEGSPARNEIDFRVTETDERFRVVRMAVCGDGFIGTAHAFLRWPPVVQATVANLAKVIDAGEFADAKVLIVGGSRGLGALTAKIIAAGGGKVIVTYATGRKEALDLVEEINCQTGDGVCRAVPYDALREMGSQLNDVDAELTHLYYFATTSIFRQKEKSFVPRLLDEFVQVYVKGFYDCCRVASRQWSRRLIAFYPSSIALEQNSMELAEYCMAKAAGETLCGALNRSTASVRIVVNRLPRLLTDQTATVAPAANGDPLQVLLPIIRKVQSAESR
jgi:acyl dehydratase/NAD(P)-dependent dehydrogenase (short-subunit alcohol dehydrogenase family)